MLSKIVEELVDTEVKKFIERHVDRVKERRIEWDNITKLKPKQFDFIGS